jgi:predicted peptidase
MPDVQGRFLQPGDRRYTIAIPTDYTTDQPVPLVLALHFGGPVTPFYGRYILTGLVEPALRGLGAIIVAPDCTASDWTHPQSEADVLALLDHIQDTYVVDPQKTLITGYSKGGQGTWCLAAQHQERFSAALIMAGWPQSDTIYVEWKIPLYVIHSREDEVIPLEPTEMVVKQLWAKRVSVELVVLEGIAHHETDRFVEPLRMAVPWLEKVWSRQVRGES